MFGRLSNCRVLSIGSVIYDVTPRSQLFPSAMANVMTLLDCPKTSKGFMALKPIMIHMMVFFTENLNSVV